MEKKIKNKLTKWRDRSLWWRRWRWWRFWKSLFNNRRFNQPKWKQPNIQMHLHHRWCSFVFLLLYNTVTITNLSMNNIFFWFCSIYILIFHQISCGHWGNKQTDKLYFKFVWLWRWKKIYYWFIYLQIYNLMCITIYLECTVLRDYFILYSFLSVCVCVFFYFLLCLFCSPTCMNCTFNCSNRDFLSI